MRPKQALVVAAGRGRRLGPHTAEIPKCMVQVGDRSILGWQCQAYRAAGIDQLVVVRGYLADVLTAGASKLADRVDFVDNDDWANNNILESMFMAKAHLNQSTLVSYSDIVFSREVAERAAAFDGDIGLVIDRDFRDIYVGRSDHPLSEAEVATVSATGLVTQVGKRSVPADDAWGEFIGLMMLSRAGAERLAGAWDHVSAEYRGRREEPFMRAPSFRQAYLTDLLQHVIDRGTEVHAIEIRGQWREIDTEQDLDRARAALASSW